MTIYEILYIKDSFLPKHKRILPRLGWKPEGEFIEPELPSEFDYYDRLMRQKPRQGKG